MSGVVTHSGFYPLLTALQSPWTLLGQARAPNPSPGGITLTGPAAAWVASQLLPTLYFRGATGAARFLFLTL